MIKNKVEIMSTFKRSESIGIIFGIIIIDSADLRYAYW